jgi:flagellar basal-body rod protein FlgB
MKLFKLIFGFLLLGNHNSLAQPFYALGPGLNQIVKGIYVDDQSGIVYLRSQRTEVLAANLANADTPGYRARDIDFKHALAAASGQGGGVHLATTRAGHIGAATANGTPAPELKYRVPLAAALDGNTVDGQLEQAAFAENTVRYQATLSFISSKFRALMTAITGQ